MSYIKKNCPIETKELSDSEMSDSNDFEVVANNEFLQHTDRYSIFDLISKVRKAIASIKRSATKMICSKSTSRMTIRKMFV